MIKTIKEFGQPGRTTMWFADAQPHMPQALVLADTVYQAGHFSDFIRQSILDSGMAEEHSLSKKDEKAIKDNPELDVINQIISDCGTDENEEVRDRLIVYAKQKGITVHHKTGIKKIKEMILEAVNGN